MGKKNRNQNSAEDDAADDFAGTDGESKEPECSGNGIGIAQNQRDNDAVGYDRAESAEEAMLPERLGPDCSKKRGQCAEYNIGQSASGQNVGEKTADGDTGNRSRSEKGKNGQYFGEADLNRTACKIKACGESGQYDVKCCDHGCLNKEQNAVTGVTGMIHDVISFSFVRVGRMNRFRPVAQRHAAYGDGITLGDQLMHA